MPLKYNSKLMPNARLLRKNLTDAEVLLWSRIRRKQLLNIQFYRQTPIGHYIVDFYAPCAKLIIEVDGAQHMAEEHLPRDKERDRYLSEHGLTVIRFDNLQVLQSIDTVLEVIFNTLDKGQKKSPRLA